MSGGKIIPLIAAGDHAVRVDALETITAALDLAKAEYDRKLAIIEAKLDREIALLRVEIAQMEGEGSAP